MHLLKFHLIIPFFLLSCSDQQDVTEVKNHYWDLFRKKKTGTETALTETGTNPVIKTTPKGNVGNYNQRKDLVKFAYRYLGTPYVYAAADPKTGFDCSGLYIMCTGILDLKSRGLQKISLISGRKSLLIMCRLVIYSSSTAPTFRLLKLVISVSFRGLPAATQILYMHPAGKPTA